MPKEPCTACVWPSKCTTALVMLLQKGAMRPQDLGARCMMHMMKMHANCLIALCSVGLDVCFVYSVLGVCAFNSSTLVFVDALPAVALMALLVALFVTDLQ